MSSGGGNRSEPDEDAFRPPPNCRFGDCIALAHGAERLQRLMDTEAQLRSTLSREKALLAEKDDLLRQKDDLLRQKDLLKREADHRLLNGLQMVASLLSLQAREVANPDAATQLNAAVTRIVSIASLHRRLTAAGASETLDLMQFLKALCRDLSGMISSDRSDNVLQFQGIELSVPSAIGIPIGFMVSELITNAAKYARGHIAVALTRRSDNRYDLSVGDNGPGLPKDFDLSCSHGLGMIILSSLVRQIGGDLHYGPRTDGPGTVFTVSFGLPQRLAE